MEDRYIATVDMGTSKIGLCVAKVTGENVQILYYKESPAAGMRYGRILNPIKAGEALKAAVHEAEESLDIKILQVVIGLPRYEVTQETATATLEHSNELTCITQEEIDAVKNLALDTYPLKNPEKETIFGAAAQSFNTDDTINCTEEDVVGMPSKTLVGNFKAFIGTKKASDNIDIMLNSAGIAPAKKLFLPTSTASAVLSPEARENGVALIEMGAGVTSVTIYRGNILRYYGAIPFGGNNITADIKYECGFTTHLAENIKLAYGACMPDKLLSMSDKILQINNSETGIDQQLSVKYLSEIITARVREIVEAILFLIQESGYADLLRAGVVLTGGCANLANCGNLIKEMSGYNVTTGFPCVRRFSFIGCPDIAETGAVASIGMLMVAKDDEHLNCTTEYIPPKTEEEIAAEEEMQKSEEERLKEEEENRKGSVFDEEGWEKTQPEKKDKGAKRAAKDRKSPLKVTWEKTSHAITGVLEKFYDTAE